MKRSYIIRTAGLFLSILTISGYSQTADTDPTKPTAAVLNLYTNLDSLTPETCGNLLRIELVKTEKYSVLDRYDILEDLRTKSLDLNDCYGKKCLSEIGRVISVEKMFSGSIEQMGNKIVISLKILDVKDETYDKTTIMEFINDRNEIQTMVQLTINTMLGIKNDPELERPLIHYIQPPEAPQVDITNNGPRVGAAIVLGDMADRMQAPISEGGWGAYPVVSQFGYQIEKEYLSAGDFHALIETLFILSGPEQRLFNPKLILMNGFRSGRTGWEFAFGPSFGIEKEADSYFNTESSTWHLASEWSELDTNGNFIANPYPIEPRMDKRGTPKLSAGWVMAIGKTFHSGHLNIPVNLFASFNKHGWQTGLSLGFNLKKRKD